MQDHQAIQDLAYQLWKAHGCPEGSAEQNWLEAERQLKGPTPALVPNRADPPKGVSPAVTSPASVPRNEPAPTAKGPTVAKPSRKAKGTSKERGDQGHDSDANA